MRYGRFRGLGFNNEVQGSMMGKNENQTKLIRNGHMQILKGTSTNLLVIPMEPCFARKT